MERLFIDSNEFLLMLQKPLSLDSCRSMLLELDERDELSMLAARSDARKQPALRQLRELPLACGLLLLFDVALKVLA